MKGNEFVLREEIIFIEYKDIVKSPVPRLIEMFATTYKDDVKDFIDISRIENLNEKDIWRLMAGRTDKNILKFLSTKSFDYDNVLNILENHHKELYMLSEPLGFLQAIHTLMEHKFTKVIYFYTEEYDPRIEFDVMEQFSIYGDRTVYISGNLESVLESMEEKPTVYVFSDVDKVGTVIDMGLQEYCEFMVAEYGYNYYIKSGYLVMRGDYDELMKEKIFKFGTFAPIQI